MAELPGGSFVGEARKWPHRDSVGSRDMASLPSNLRRDLERAIIRARRIAVAGSQSALEALTVHEGKRGPHITSEKQIALRNHLRAHAKQIGDRRNSQSGAQAIDRLVQECAYEHWHRMIFGRFLAENNLLVEPDSQVSVTLEDVEELARDEGIERWELVGRFAQKSLPAIFRADDPLLRVTLPRETRLQLDALLDEIPSETFLADDSLGWVYQFWQSAEKERVNSEGEKITGETLPAVTQLFTEHYMVLFLLHNTLGAWYAGKVLAARPSLAQTAASEAALRGALRLTEAGGYDFEYLRFVRVIEAGEQAAEEEASGRWRPMGGTFHGWPKTAAELKVLDPCCGSGHFLVAAFELLVRLRTHEEALSIAEAVDAVIRDNLFGLEIDPRCTQIAAFNVAVAAWKLTGPRPLPPLRNIACTGLSVGVSRETWMQALESDGSTNLRFYFGQLYDMFSNASTLGSLINPNRFLGSHMLRPADMDRLFKSLDVVIAKDPSTAPEEHELGVAAQGMARAAGLLSGRYHLVVTNVPYLGRSKQDEILKKHIDTYYELGKADLATAFLLRCVEFVDGQGTCALVTPQNWLFLSTYHKLRESLLGTKEWNLVVRLGSNAFQDMNWWAATTALIVLTSRHAQKGHRLGGIDVSEDKQQTEKAAMLRGERYAQMHLVGQEGQFNNPDARIMTTETTDQGWLSDLAQYGKGSTTGDGPRFLHAFWEHPRILKSHVLWLNSPTPNSYWSGRNTICVVPLSDPSLVDQLGCRIHGQEVWGHRGVAVNKMRQLEPFFYEGEVFDDNVCPITPRNPNDLPALWTFVSSDGYRSSVRKIDQALKVTAATLTKVPFDLDYWRDVAKQMGIAELPQPESDDPTQWLFHGRPDCSSAPNHVAVARLLGYRWPAELDSTMRLSERAHELVRSCDALLRFSDSDGIVCIPPVRGEETAAARLASLLDGCGIKPPQQLDDWLRNGFYHEHCELFLQVPFIWHIWDGRKADGFQALVNYHKLAGPGGRKLLENLTYSYLGEWINRQESDVKRGESGADGRLAAARTLQERLIAILAGEPPFDIFVRWKPLQEQPIGWNPDINDGVRINIRPFLARDIPDGRKGAGILRWGPKITWNKDRGKESKRPREEYPWFWNWDGTEDYAGGDTFTGDRWNDCHYTTAFKHRARQAAKAK